MRIYSTKVVNQEDLSEPDRMADSRKEVVSSSRKMTTRQESSTSSSSMMQQQHQQQQQQQQQISSTTQSQSLKQQSQSTVVSTSSIQLKEKQETRNQIQSQTSITQSSKQQIQMQNQSVTQSSNQLTQQQQQQQKSITQKQQSISQNQIQNQTSLQQQQQQQLLLQQQQLQQQQLQLQNNNDEDQNGEEDLKVIGASHTPMDLAEENDLYFANLIKKEQILNCENYTLSDDVSVVESNATNHSSLIIHPDLLTGLTSPSSPPPSLVLAQSEAGSHVDIDQDDRFQEISSRSSSKSFEGSFSQDQSIEGDLDEQDLEDEEEEEDDFDEDEPNIDDARKKKKKVKKTESFSVKSSFSKFENPAGNPNNRSTPENDEERANKAKNENAKSGTKICKGCDREVFVMEMIKAEKASWHKQCFRCVECKKTLSVDTYQSNLGQVYCKPHFKELFQPKVVLESPEEKLLQRIKKRPEVIIRENEPVELPPDVVRATVQPSTAELEDLSVDVRSKFELFEHYQESENTNKDRREPVIVKKSTTVLAKLAKYEGAMDGVGVPDAELNGGAPALVSDDEDDDNVASRKLQHLDEINIKLDDVKSKWESGMNSKKEEIHKHRQEELAKFRTRLCLGKNSQLKEMYEKAVESSENEVRRNSDLEQLDFKGKRDIKEMFEKGLVRQNDEDDEEENGRETAVDRDRDVFENGVAKNSRNLFQNLDKQLSTGGQTPPILPSGPKKIVLKNPKDIIGVNDQSEIVKSSDIIEDEIRTEDVGNKFRFFETYQENQESTKQKKTFRITPPREGQVKMDSPEREIYRDPNVVRSSDTEQVQIPASRTASKMLSVFKKMEETAAGSDEVDLSRPQRRPLKQFTPPRETRIERKNSSEEEEAEQSSEYETDEEYENGGANNEDQFLKEVGSLAKAKSLRAKFEKWEIEENNRNQQQTAKMEYMQMQQTQSETQSEQQTQEEMTYGSIESAKALRAKFEQPQQFDQNKLQRREVQVKRFV
ncbi:unnamed protein product [Allacma fusca]|uniref:LIM zinc-binding domain-containing protein n=1 Tax=Allacma fusca TaxID=39272 RepID=A0A8J2NZL1_9HEXA|nr:unnamed protein product [Allacma fusca]